MVTVLTVFAWGVIPLLTVLLVTPWRGLLEARAEAIALEAKTKRDKEIQRQLQADTNFQQSLLDHEADRELRILRGRQNLEIDRLRAEKELETWGELKAIEAATAKVDAERGVFEAKRAYLELEMKLANKEEARRHEFQHYSPFPRR